MGDKRQETLEDDGELSVQIDGGLVAERIIQAQNESKTPFKSLQLVAWSSYQVGDNILYGRGRKGST